MNTLVDHRNVTIRIRGPVDRYVVCVKCKGAKRVTFTSYSSPPGRYPHIWVGGEMWCPSCGGEGYWEEAK